MVNSFQGCTANKNDVVWGSCGCVPYRGLGIVVMGGRRFARAGLSGSRILC